MARQARGAALSAPWLLRKRAAAPFLVYMLAAGLLSARQVAWLLCLLPGRAGRLHGAPGGSEQLRSTCALHFRAILAPLRMRVRFQVCRTLSMLYLLLGRGQWLWCGLCNYSAGVDHGHG